MRQIFCVFSLIFFPILSYGQSDIDFISDGIEDMECVLLKTFFQEKAFYELPSLNLTYADTITVLDKSRFFNDCQDIVIEGKVLVIKKVDLIPYPLVADWNSYPEYKIKYNNYFIIEKPEIKGRLIIINFFVVLSNHNGFFAYKIIDGKLQLIDYQIGQY